MGPLYALVVLAWALVRALLARLTRRETGLRVFRANYAADRLPAATPEERDALMGMSGCIACGLCDLGAAHSSGAGPMDLALASSRSTPDADAAALSLARWPDELLAEKERICPTAVPLRAIAALTRARAERVAAGGVALRASPRAR